MFKIPEVEYNINPDHWVIVEIASGGENLKKILASWGDNQLLGSKVRISSPIVSVSLLEKEETFYVVKTSSGSIYHLNKNNHKLVPSHLNLYNSLKDQADSGLTVRLKDTNFIKELDENYTNGYNDGYNDGYVNNPMHNEKTDQTQEYILGYGAGFKDGFTSGLEDNLDVI